MFDRSGTGQGGVNDRSLINVSTLLCTVFSRNSPPMPVLFLEEIPVELQGQKEPPFPAWGRLWEIPN